MPELPEVETTKNGIAPHIQHKTIHRVTVRQPQLRWPIPSNLSILLEGSVVTDIQRRAKYLLLHCDGESATGWLMIHLGMSGNLRVVQPEADIQKHDHVDIAFADGTTLRYQDPRRFGCVLWLGEDKDSHKLLAKLGPEPLSDDFNADYLYGKAKGRKVAVKQFVMNQEVVTGIGNIYANEALFKAGIHPQQPAGDVPLGQYSVFVTAAKSTLAKAIEQGGTTLKDFVGGDGKPGYFQQSLLVYGRDGQPCTQCGTELTLIRLNGRASVYCPSCQPLR